MSKESRRTKGVKLIARRDGEYYFVDSVFDHGDGLAGCTGTVCYPVSEEQAEELLSMDNLEERFGDHWEERYKDDVDSECEECDGCINDEGCDSCGYPSLRSLCSEIVRFEGIESVIDWLGSDYTDALEGAGADAMYADCTGCGRIFGNCGRPGPMDPNEFDEVYDKKALVAILAFESGVVSFEYASKAIFG